MTSRPSAARHLPACGTAKVAKEIMSPRLAARASATPRRRRRRRRASLRTTRPRSPWCPPQEHELRKKLKELRQHLTRIQIMSAEISEEAARMHYGEIDHRSIYGEARPTMQEAARGSIEFIRAVLRTTGISAFSGNAPASSQDAAVGVK